MVQFKLNLKVEFGEVQFYFFNIDADDDGQQIAYALVSKYGPPDQQMLDESLHTLHACEYLGSNDLVAIPVTSIISVISMQPLPALPGDRENLWFVVEKSGLDDVELTGYNEFDDPEAQ